MKLTPLQVLRVRSAQQTLLFTRASTQLQLELANVKLSLTLTEIERDLGIRIPENFTLLDDGTVEASDPQK